MKYLLFVSQSYSMSILRPLQNAILNRGGEVAWYLYEVDPSLLQKHEQQLISIDEVNEFSADAVFVPGNWVPDFFPGIKVEIFHGFGIEKKGHFRIRGFFDLYCTHGPATTKRLQQSAKKHGYFQVIETGWPKMDPLFLGKSTILEPLFSQEKKTVLYAPTFSPSLSSASSLFDEISKSSISGDYNWIIKFHSKMNKSIIKQYSDIENKNLKIYKEQDILPLLHIADVMLTDSSSVISEFLLLEKPVITFNNSSPDEHILDFTKPSSLQSVLSQAIDNPEKIVSKSKQYINGMHPYRDGKSSERILEAVDLHLNEGRKGLKRKPLNLIRKLQVRKKLNHFCF